MENLNKLKELEYLNLALNNISKIENISGCESLKKIDLTVNFIGLDNLEESCINLAKNPVVREIYLVGNPCADWKNYKKFVIATVPQLEAIDGDDIEPSDRIKAHQQYDELLEELQYEMEIANIAALKKQREHEEHMRLNPDDDKQPYTKQVRREMYADLAKDKLEKDKRQNPDKYKEKPKPSNMYRNDGDIRQCNEGKYVFRLAEWDDPYKTTFELKVPKYLDTSQLDVNINPKWVSVRVKGKLTTLKFMDEVSIEDAKIERSQITGILTITMNKLETNVYLEGEKMREKKKKEQEEEDKKQESQKKMQDKQKLLEMCDKIDRKQLQTNEDHFSLDDVPDLE